MTMQNKLKHQFAQLACITSALCSTGWAVNSMACGSDPYMSSVCAMAFAGSQYSDGFGKNVYLPAHGQSLQISQYSAMFALLGTTYGGNGSTNFNLPDLRGRVIVGSGTADYGTDYTIGQKGGSATATLTDKNLPAHNHSIITGAGGVIVNAGTGTLNVNVGLGSLAATTSLSSVTGSANGSDLTLNASSAAADSRLPGGNSLAATSATAPTYKNVTPDVALRAGSISGTAPVSFTGNPTTTLSGAPSANLTGAPSVALSGNTGITGTSAAFSVMPPYLVLRYYIAVQGIFPSPNKSRAKITPK